MAKQAKHKKQNNKKLNILNIFKNKQVDGLVASLAIVGAIAFVTFPANQANGLSSTASAKCNVNFNAKTHTALTQYNGYIVVKNTSVVTINTTINVVASVYFPDGTFINSDTHNYPVTLTKGQKINVYLPTYTFPEAKEKTVITATNVDPAFTCTKSVVSRG